MGEETTVTNHLSLLGVSYLPRQQVTAITDITLGLELPLTCILGEKPSLLLAMVNNRKHSVDAQIEVIRSHHFQFLDANGDVEVRLWHENPLMRVHDRLTPLVPAWCFAEDCSDLPGR